MAILMFGSGFPTIDPLSPTSTAWTTAAASLIGPYSLSGTGSRSGDLVRLPEFTANADVWVSGWFDNITTNQQSEAFVQFYNGNDPLARVYFDTGSNVLDLDFYNGSSWVDSGETPVELTLTGGARMDVRLNLNDTTGVFQVYIDGQLILDFSGDTITNGTIGTCNRIDLGTPGSSSIGYWSQWFVADEDSRNIEMQELQATANGNYTAWNGDYTAIDELGASDGASISSGTANQLETFTKTALDTNLNSGYTVKGIGVLTRAKKSGSGPQNLQHVIRSGTTDGVSANVSNLLNGSYDIQTSFFATDPNTASAWTFANLDSAEFGVKSIT